MAINETSKSTVILNGQQAEAELKKLKTRADSLNKEINQMRKNNDKAGFDKLSKELRQVRTEMKSVKQQSKDVGLVLKNIKTAPVNDLKMASRKLNKELNGMTRGTKEFVLKSKQLKKVSAELKKVRNTARDTRSMIGRMSDGFNKFFGVIAAGGAILVGFVMRFQRMTDSIVDFEKGMTNVKTLLSDEQLAESGQQLDDLALSLIKRGHAIDTTTKSIFDAISAGVDAAEAVQFMDNADRLAVGGKTELATATDGLTSVMNAYGKSVSESGEIADAFFSAQKAGKTTVAELAANIGQIAPIAASLDVSYQELLSSQAALTKKGISTAEATTYLKGAMTALIKPTDLASKLFQQEFGHGLGASEVKAQGFTTILGELSQLMQKYPDAMAEAIPNVRGLTAVTALAGDGFESYTDILEQVKNDIGETSSLSSAYAKQQETTDMAIRRAKGTLTELTLSMREQLAPIMIRGANLVEQFATGLKNFTRYVKENKDTIKTLAKVIGYATGILLTYKIAVKSASILTTVFSAVSKALGTVMAVMTGKIKIATIAQKALNMAMRLNPVGLIITAITILGVLIWKFRKQIVDIAKKVWTFIERFKAVKIAIMAIFWPITALVAAYKKLQDVITGTTEAERDHEKQLEKSRKQYLKNMDAYDKKTDQYIEKLKAMGKTEDQILKASIRRAKQKLARTKYHLGAEHEETKKAHEDLKQLQTDLVNYQLRKVAEAEEAKKQVAEEAELERQRQSAASAQKQKEEDDKLAKQKIDDLEKLTADLKAIQQQIDLDKLEDRDRALEELRIEYEKKRELAHGNAEALKEIDRLFKEEKQIIDDEWDLKEKEKQDKYNLEKEELRQQLKEKSLSDDELEIWQAQQKWDKLIAQAIKYGLDTTKLKQLQADEMLAIQKKQIADEIINQREARNKRIEADFQEFQARAALAKNLFGVVSNMMEQMGAEDSKMIGFQKTVALIQIGIDSASAISKYIAQGITGEPISTAANIATGIGIVTTNMLKAKKVLSDTGEVPQYASGKYTVKGASDGKTYSNIPYIGTPSTGMYTSPALFAEDGGEFIVSSTDLGDPMIANFVGMIQALKFNQNATEVPQYADGKDVSNDQSVEMHDMLKRLGMSIDQLSHMLANPVPNIAVIDRDNVINITEAQDDFSDAAAVRASS